MSRSQPRPSDGVSHGESFVRRALRRRALGLALGLPPLSDQDVRDAATMDRGRTTNDEAEYLQRVGRN